jgi:hypothetical protein
MTFCVDFEEANLPYASCLTEVVYGIEFRYDAIRGISDVKLGRLVGGNERCIASSAAQSDVEDMHIRKKSNFLR